MLASVEARRVNVTLDKLEKLRQGQKELLVVALEQNDELKTARSEILFKWKGFLGGVGVKDVDDFIGDNEDWAMQFSDGYVPHITLGELVGQSAVVPNENVKGVGVELGEARLGNVRIEEVGLLESGEDGQLSREWKQIQEMSMFANEIVQSFKTVIERHYGVELRGGDVGSFTKGTFDLEATPDVDPTFVGVPDGEPEGKEIEMKTGEPAYVDWKDLEDYSVLGMEGIRNIKEVRQRDQRLAETIEELMSVLNKMGSGAKFEWVRSWPGFPGLIANVSFSHPQYEERLAFDVGLYQAQEYFGLDHAERFLAYTKRYEMEYGRRKLFDLLSDIRKFKRLTKEAALDENGGIDRTKKVPGFVAEALFTYEYPPRSFDDLMDLLGGVELSKGDINELPNRLANNTEPLIDAQRTVFDVLLSLSRGGYETVKAVAQGE